MVYLWSVLSFAGLTTVLAALLLVAERMRERKLAPVMAQMNPLKAKEMTVELSQRRRLPEPGSRIGG